MLSASLNKIFNFHEQNEELPTLYIKFSVVLSEFIFPSTCFINCPTSYNRKYNVLSASLNKTFNFHEQNQELATLYIKFSVYY